MPRSFALLRINGILEELDETKKKGKRKKKREKEENRRFEIGGMDYSPVHEQKPSPLRSRVDFVDFRSDSKAKQFPRPVVDYYRE